MTLILFYDHNFQDNQGITMKDLLLKLTRKQKQVLFNDLNYLNLKEIKAFCKKHHLPIVIHIEIAKDHYIKTTEIDRKGVLLARIKQYLLAQIIQSPTIFNSKVISFTLLPKNIHEKNKVLYGQYKNKNPLILKLMKKLTNNQFTYGAISQEVIRKFWAKGIAPTYQSFAKAWLKAKIFHDKPNAEWAYLTDKSKGLVYSDWKKLRVQKAKSVLVILNTIKSKFKIS